MGDATFTIPGSLYSIIPANNKFDADLPLPANFDLGLSFKASEKLLLAAEINYVFWDVYDSLNFTFKKNACHIKLKQSKAIFKHFAHTSWSGIYL